MNTDLDSSCIGWTFYHTRNVCRPLPGSGGGGVRGGRVQYGGVTLCLLEHTDHISRGNEVSLSLSLSLHKNPAIVLNPNQ